MTMTNLPTTFGARRAVIQVSLVWWCDLTSDSAPHFVPLAVVCTVCVKANLWWSCLERDCCTRRTSHSRIAESGFPAYYSSTHTVHLVHSTIQYTGTHSLCFPMNITVSQFGKSRHMTPILFSLSLQALASWASASCASPRCWCPTTACGWARATASSSRCLSTVLAGSGRREKHSRRQRRRSPSATPSAGSPPWRRGRRSGCTRTPRARGWSGRHSFLTATWHRRSYHSTGTGTPSSSSSPCRVRDQLGFSSSICCSFAMAFIPFSGHGGLALNPTSSSSSSPIKDPTSAKEASSMLVMSGGEGYIDFRIGKRNGRSKYVRVQ